MWRWLMKKKRKNFFEHKNNTIVNTHTLQIYGRNFCWEEHLYLSSDLSKITLSKWLEYQQNDSKQIVKLYHLYIYSNNKQLSSSINHFYNKFKCWKIMLQRNSFIFQPCTRELLIITTEKTKFDKNLFWFYLCYFSNAFV